MQRLYSPQRDTLRRKSTIIVCVLVIGLFCARTHRIEASDQIPGKPQSGPIAIVGAVLHTVTDGTKEDAWIVFDEGKISAIGAGEPQLPVGCEVMDGSGKHVYPSLIEGYSDIGLVEINSVRATMDNRETGSFNPNVRAAAAFNPDSELIPVNRANGILISLSAPTGGIVSGRSALMMLDGWTWEDMTLKPDVGMHITWSRSGDMESLEEFVTQTKRYMAAVEDSDASQPVDLRLAAFARVFAGEMPIIVSADTIDQITSSIAFAKRHGVQLMIHGGADAAKCSSLLKRESIPVMISGVYRTPRRRHAAYDEAYALPSQLEKAGVAFCITAGGRFGASGMRNLPYHAATAVAYGLSPEVALESMTIRTAEILGVADQIGSLEVGKDATLFIADGDILETPTKVESAFIQGRAVDLDNKHKQLYRKYSAKYAESESE